MRNIHYSLFIILWLLISPFFACLIQFGLGKLIGYYLPAASKGTDYQDVLINPAAAPKTMAGVSSITAGQAFGQKNTSLGVWMANMYLDPMASLGAAAALSFSIRERRKGFSSSSCVGWRLYLSAKCVILSSCPSVGTVGKIAVSSAERSDCSGTGAGSSASACSGAGAAEGASAGAAGSPVNWVRISSMERSKSSLCMIASVSYALPPCRAVSRSLSSTISHFPSV